jgi:hypothetical protein
MYRVYVQKTWVDFSSKDDALWHYKKYGWKLTHLFMDEERLICSKRKS